MEFLTLSLHQATECFFMRKEPEMKTIEIITLILSIVLIALIVGGLFYYIHHNKKREQALVNSVNQTGDLAILNDRLNALTQAVNTQLNQQNQDALKNTEK
jgi:type VI protein secretion system component VasK